MSSFKLQMVDHMINLDAFIYLPCMEELWDKWDYVFFLNIFFKLKLVGNLPLNHDLHVRWIMKFDLFIWFIDLFCITSD